MVAILLRIVFGEDIVEVRSYTQLLRDIVVCRSRPDECGRMQKLTCGCQLGHLFLIQLRETYTHIRIIDEPVMFIALTEKRPVSPSYKP